MMKLRLSWTDPVSQRFRRPLLNVPVALGQNFDVMPGEVKGQWVSRMAIGDRQFEDFHALIVEIKDQIYLINQGGKTYLNGSLVSERAQLEHGDCIRIGQTELQLEIVATLHAVSNQPATHLQIVPDPVRESGGKTAQVDVQNEGLGGDDANDDGRKVKGNTASAHGSLNGHIAKSNGHIAESNGHVASNDHVAKSNGYSPVMNGYVAKSNGHIAESNGHVASNDHSHSNGLAHAGSSQFQSPAIPPPPKPVASVASEDAVPQPQQPSHEFNSGCRRMVGFLFKRPCGRSNKMGCHHCAKGYSHQAYQADYELYEGFGRYEPGDWGYGLLANQENG